jgi:integrase
MSARALGLRSCCRSPRVTWIPGRELIAVVGKGTRERQELPASTDAFVWLRLYQLQMEGLIPRGRRQPLWWTSRTPVRPLTYHAAHRMFERAGQAAGSTATLHALRHTAAYRMAEDPALPLTDVQLVLGHALLSTTQIYTSKRASLKPNAKAGSARSKACTSASPQPTTNSPRSTDDPATPPPPISEPPAFPTDS